MSYIAQQEFVVSTHSRLKAAGGLTQQNVADITVSTHSRLKAAGTRKFKRFANRKVSTHSRLKAAGIKIGYGLFDETFQHTAA